MNQLTKYLNYLYYSFYRFDIKLHKLFNCINPIWMIYRIPFIQKFYERHGVKNMLKYTDDHVFENKITGISIIRAGVYLGSLEVMLLYSIFNFFGKTANSIVWGNNIYRALLIIILFSLPTFFNYFLIFNNNRYLTYFSEFEKMDRSKIWFYNIVVLGVVLLVITTLIFSFVFL